jgi:hypothetical protein
MPDDSTEVSLMYGPVVLAGQLGTERMTPQMREGFGFPDVDRMFTEGAAMETPVLVPPSPALTDWIRPVRGKTLTFRTVNTGKPHDFTFSPFYLTFGQRYAVYVNLYSPAEWKAILKDRTPLPGGVVDRVVVGNMQSEKEHNFQAYRSSRGESGGRRWVRSPLWFRYDMNVLPDSQMTLLCTYTGDAKDQSFDILIDGLPMKEETLQAAKPGEPTAMSYDIPFDLLKGKRRVAIMFRGKNNRSTPGLFECTTTRLLH